MADDDYTADEIKDFETVSDEDRGKLERYLKWHSKKNASAGDPQKSAASPPSSG